jgi:hypothetical protein
MDELAISRLISSTSHGLWHCARMLGVKDKIEGFGLVMVA